MDYRKHLKSTINDYLEIKDSIKTGLERKEEIEKNRKIILEKLKGTEEEWKDCRWLLKNRIDTAERLKNIFPLTDEEIKEVDKVANTYRFAISPYYLSLIDTEDFKDPIKLQAIPSGKELIGHGDLDPMDEKGTTPVEGITRRYPDRLIVKVTNQCGMYCRFCLRRRLIGETDHHIDRKTLEEDIEYIRNNEEIRDILLTGGDAFMLSDSTIEWLLQELRSIPHVEIIRFGTRTPVTLPQRVTDNLVNILKKYHPVYVNTHFNSPAEITEESKEACEKLANAGIPLGNQMVLLNNVNNDPMVVRKLNQALLTIRVKPYYIFHTKPVKGTEHFWCRVEEGLEIMESLRGRTSGMAIPSYIVNGPGGLGKTPVLPNYLQYIGRDKAYFRNWNGVPFEIENKFDDIE